MKKHFAVLLLVMFALALQAGNNEAASYVKTGDKIYFGQKVKTGLLNATIVMNDGTMLKIPYKKVDSYYSNGRLFERLPVMCEGAPANCTALMEYVTSRNGLRLYKYCKYGECGDLLNNTYKKAHLQVTYFVFQDGKFYLHVDKKNAPTVLPFFGIPVV